MPSAEQIIARLALQPLIPEGGYFARTWTAGGAGRSAAPAGSAIYFCLTKETFSAFHRLKAEELWHFYAGDPVEHWQLREGDRPLRSILGADVLAGEQPQHAVPAGAWQAARIDSRRVKHGWSLLGCTLCPGWRDEDFELGSRSLLSPQVEKEFPSLAELFRR